VSADGTQVTWKLKRNVTWHDGRPFTADDVLFTAAYAGDPASATVSVAVYKDIKVEKVDSHTVRVTFPKATPFWAEPFVGSYGMILPKHVFEPFIGAKSREAPANVKPVGTGPYEFVDFKPGDMLRGKAFANYHVPEPALLRHRRGQGRRRRAQRRALGDADRRVRLRLEPGGRGRTAQAHGSRRPQQARVPDRQRHRVHFAQRHRPLERSRRRTSQRQEQAPGVQRQGGARRDGAARRPQGRPGLHLRPRRHRHQQLPEQPARFRSPNTSYEFNVDKANQILDGAGWRRGSDGIRAKGDVKLKFVFQTSVSQPRQKTQAIVKDACTKAGIDLELKSVTAAGVLRQRRRQSGHVPEVLVRRPDVHDDDDAARPADLHGAVHHRPDRQKANKWASRNLVRWSNAEYDATFKAAQVEFDAASARRCSSR
jgi:peptide/nickel transport system substrate-binding protein